MKDQKEILDIVCSQLEVDCDKVMTSSRKRELVECRQIVSHVLRFSCDLKLKAIGLFLNRDHTSVMNNLDNYENDYKVNYKNFKEKADRCLQYIECE